MSGHRSRTPFRTLIAPSDLTTGNEYTLKLTAVFCAVGEALIYLVACLRQVRHEAVAVQAAASTTVNPFAKRLRDGAFGRDSRQSFLWRPKAEQLLTGHEDTYHA
ncbi:hypothetical protein AN414_07730 [Serratia marcescens]|nr:hypothetical protein AN414_07730 [Serratia marcescens]